MIATIDGGVCWLAGIEPPIRRNRTDSLYAIVFLPAYYCVLSGTIFCLRLLNPRIGREGVALLTLIVAMFLLYSISSHLNRLVAAVVLWVWFYLGQLRGEFLGALNGLSHTFGANGEVFSLLAPSAYWALEVFNYVVFGAAIRLVLISIRLRREFLTIQTERTTSASRLFAALAIVVAFMAGSAGFMATYWFGYQYVYGDGSPPAGFVLFRWFVAVACATTVGISLMQYREFSATYRWAKEERERLR